MGNFYNKHFRKSKSIKALLFDTGQKQTVHYVVPKGNYITIEGKTFTLDHENFFIDHKKFVTYVFQHGNVEPINPTDVENRAQFDPERLNTGIENRVAQHIIQESRKVIDTTTALIILGVFMLVGFGFLYYTLSSELESLREIINQIRIPEVVE